MTVREWALVYIVFLTCIAVGLGTFLIRDSHRIFPRQGRKEQAEKEGHDTSTLGQ